MLTTIAIKTSPLRDRSYKLADTGGLFLLVEPNGTKKWRYKFRLNGQEALMALGAFPEVSLAEAREAHLHARKLVSQGISPVQERRKNREALRESHRSQTRGRFGTVMESWLDRRASELRRSTLVQTKRELTKHIEPAFGQRDLSTLTRPEITELLRTVQKTAPETARNLRGHLHAIFEHAIDSGVVQSNPTPPGRVLGKRTHQHHPALPVRELGALLRRLDAITTIYERTRCALLLVLLTAGRKTEITASKWVEFDLKGAEWHIPASRMKANRSHWVPLSKQAVQLLKGLQQLNHGRSEYVFPHRDRPNRPMEGASLNALLTRMGYRGLATPHGMRATFSTHFNALGANEDVIERCLAHEPANQVRSAYNRHEYKEERRALLQQWADHLDQLRTGKTPSSRTATPDPRLASESQPRPPAPKPVNVPLARRKLSTESVHNKSGNTSTARSTQRFIELHKE